jgi:hypothetical protein
VGKPGGKNPGGKPRARLLGSGSSKTTPAQTKARGGLPIAPLDPSQSGNPDVVQQRTAAAMQGKMLKDQLKKNKSA